ncbi:unnamed protein product [Schistocephalus solidus]|uniref:Transmembrane protein n=1 Tax=Schistocephalus solidus TaxID=70667 RepID=A0A183SSH3_SCHSO|nr:unnamed protein product [Schistocephalus solidus]
MENNQTPPYTPKPALHGDARSIKPQLPTIYDSSSQGEDSEDIENGAVSVESPGFVAVAPPPMGLSISTVTELPVQKKDSGSLMPKSAKLEKKEARLTFSTSSPESSTSQCNNKEQKDVRLSGRSSPSTLSTLTSLSEERKEANSNAENPNVHLNYLRHVHNRARRRKRLRKFLKVLHSFIVCGIPLVSILLGILGILTGHFLHVNSFLVAGCLLLIAACGLILQSCFWNRSMPNKFKPGEIAFNMPQEGSPDAIKFCPQPTETEVILEQTKISEEDLHSQENGKRASPCPSIAVRTERILSGTTPTFSVDSLSTGMNPAQFRRLSIALNRATEELSAVRRMTPSSGDRMLNLARRLTMGPNFDAFEGERGLAAGNEWIGGRVPHGVRRGLAWNATGASRFYASNYD